MAGFSAQGATLTFNWTREVGLQSVSGTFGAAIVGVSVETPVAEVVDMTAVDDPPGYSVLVPTGDWSGGGVTVEYIATTATGDVQNVVRGVGDLAFTSPRFSVTRRAILESASQEIRFGDVVRGTLNFRLTDYTQ